MLKLEENPPPLLPTAASVADLAGDWWVAHTRPRCEKALAFDLLAQNVGYYLPMTLKVIVSGGRKRKGLYPLFPGYVFFCGGADERATALYTNRVAQVLPVSRRDQFVGEMAAVERVLARNATLDLYPFAAVGKRCRVRTGALVGTEGIVIRRNKQTVLILTVSMLGCGAALEIDPSLLEPAE